MRFFVPLYMKNTEKGQKIEKISICNLYIQNIIVLLSH